MFTRQPYFCWDDEPFSNVILVCDDQGLPEDHGSQTHSVTSPYPNTKPQPVVERRSNPNLSQE